MASRSEDTRCTACNGTGETPLVGGGYDPTRPRPVCAGTGSREQTITAELDRLRHRERVCDSQCGAIQQVAAAWYRAEAEFDLSDDDPYEAIKRLREIESLAKQLVDAIRDGDRPSRNEAEALLAVTLRN